MTGRSRILIVEDDVLIAMELEERLGEMGYAVVGPAMTVAAAEQAIAQEKPDAALLDANVAGVSSVALGARLAAQGVPVAFCTGYDSIKDLPPELAQAAILTKPVGEAALRQTLRQLLGR
jgi:DNA-binding response OmpR family regulator